MAFPRTTPTPTSVRSWCSGRGFPRTPCTLSPSSSSSAPSSSGSSPPTNREYERRGLLLFGCVISGNRTKKIRQTIWWLPSKLKKT